MLQSMSAFPDKGNPDRNRLTDNRLQKQGRTVFQDRLYKGDILCLMYGGKNGV